MQKIKIDTSEAPSAIGPYSQGVKVTGATSLLFISGQLPVDSKTGQLVEGGIEEMTWQVLRNIEAILKKGESGKGEIVRMEIFLTRLNADFKSVGRVLNEWLLDVPVLPARQTIEVAALPLGSSIEISCIAAKG